MRFGGTISFIEKHGSLFARGTYLKDGKRKQVCRKVVGKRKDAQNAVIDEIERILQGIEEPRTFHDLAQYYLKEKAVPAEFSQDRKIAGMKTYQKRISVIKQLDAYFGNVKLERITRDAVQRYRAHIAKKQVRKKNEFGNFIWVERSLASVNEHLRTLRAMLNTAEHERWLDRKPSFKGLISLAAETRREDIPDKDEFLKILQACNTRQRLNHIKPIVLMIADTGARPVELWQLKWTDVDLEKGFVTLMSDKGVKRTYRTNPLTSRVVSELGKLDKYNEYVFGGIKGIKRGWRSIREISGCEVDLYSLRHVFATRLDMMPISQTQRQLLMGHAPKDTFARYAKLTSEVIEMVRERLESDPYSS